MKQHYFVVVLAHSLHGRLRRIHIPHQALYLVVGLALFGSVSLFGMVSSYLRMTWKVSNYNSLRDQVDTLRNKYQALLAENGQKEEQLASFQMMASEVSVALGLNQGSVATDDIAEEGPLVPDYKESIDEYNFLKTASISRLNHEYAHAWQKNVVPSLWPVNGRLLSRFGDRERSVLLLKAESWRVSLRRRHLRRHGHSGSRRRRRRSRIRGIPARWLRQDWWSSIMATA